MGALIRVFVLVSAFVIIVGCASREEARRQPGLEPEEGSQIPAATPGPGLEKIQNRPRATPTPKPTDPMDKPLDPTGLPQG